MTSALAERTLSLLVFGRLPDRMCDREPAGVASELGRLVGSAPEGGVVEGQSFENGKRGQGTNSEFDKVSP